MNKIYRLTLIFAFVSTSLFAQFPLSSIGEPSGGSSDHTNTINPHLKLQSNLDYVRVTHLSASSSISSVYNYQAGKNVYWGEDTDGGQYLFRGRDVNMGRNLTVNGNLGVGLNNASWIPQTGVFEVRNGSALGSANGSKILLTSTSTTNATNYFQNNVWARRVGSSTDWLTTRLHDAISVDVSYLNPGTDTRTWWERAPLQDYQLWGTGSQTYMALMGSNLWVGPVIQNTQYRLAVAGKIAATGEVRVFTDGTTSFPDYVFEPSYKLPLLEDTEAYIKENKHLPEVPSAKEIEKDGMSLNDMNVILLKKVEELTLYMIEIKKENDLIKKEIKELKEKQNSGLPSIKYGKKPID